MRPTGSALGDGAVAEVGGFVALPLRFPATRAWNIETHHWLYVKPNQPKQDLSGHEERELWIGNVPIDATENSIRSVVTALIGAGRVEEVRFEAEGRKKQDISKSTHVKRKNSPNELEAVHSLPRITERDVHMSGGTAVIRLADRASAELTLKAARKRAKRGEDVQWEPDSSAPALGSARYKAHHALRFPPPSALLASADAYMAAYAERETEHARQLAQQRMEPDEDGFVKVVRGGRTGPARMAEVKAKEEELKKRGEKRMRPDFYRFQLRERKKEEAKGLVDQFAEDARKLEELRKRKRGSNPS